MSKEVGLWIDHKRAVIVILSEAGEEVRQVESSVARHSRYHGATHPKTPYSAQYQKGDDQLDRQVAEQLGKYYTSVIAHLRGTDALLIFGPGEAKHELQKRLSQANLCPENTEIEAADKMTGPQISAKVRTYFQRAMKQT